MPGKEKSLLTITAGVHFEIPGALLVTPGVPSVYISA